MNPNLVLVGHRGGVGVLLGTPVLIQSVNSVTVVTHVKVLCQIVISFKERWDVRLKRKLIGVSMSYHCDPK